MSPSHGSRIYELLRTVNPVDTDGLAEPSRSPEAQALYQRIVAAEPAEAAELPRRVPLRRRSPRLRLSLASLVAVAGVGAGVSYAISNGGGSQKATVACYASPALDASFSVFPASGTDPVATCRQAWALGRVPGQPASPEPSLRACLLPAHTVGVFPAPASAPDFCASLDLSPLPGSSSLPLPSAPTTAPANQVAAMTDSVTQVLSAGCLGEGEARTAIRAALDQAGLTGWTVESKAPLTADRPCASPGIDEVNHVVLIIPNVRP